MHISFDAPTSGFEAPNMTFTFVASNDCAVKSVDIASAYFRGQLRGMASLLRRPKGGCQGVR